MHALHIRFHCGLRRLRLAVQGDVGSDASVRHAEVEGLEAQHRILEDEVRRERVERNLLRPQDTLRGELHIRIHQAPLLGADRLMRKHPRARLLLGGLLGFLRRLLVLRRLRRPDDRAEVLEVELLRLEIRDHRRPRLGLAEGEVTTKIAVSHRALERVEHPLLAVVAQAPRELVLRRVGKDDTDEVVQVLHRVAADGEVEIERLQVLRDVAVGRRFCRPDRALALEADRARGIGLQ